MKAISSVCILLLCFGLQGIHGEEVFGQQTDTIRLNKLELKRGAKKVFDTKDSVLVLQIDTLIMKDRSSLQFFGKKKVKLLVNHAELGKRVYFLGRSHQNNASDMDISIKFDKLGSLFVMADGYDANNGSRTDPNGDGGNVRLVYSNDGIHPQQQQSRDQNYLHINTLGGGRHVNATACGGGPGGGQQSQADPGR